MYYRLRPVTAVAAGLLALLCQRLPALPLRDRLVRRCAAHFRQPYILPGSYLPVALDSQEDWDFVLWEIECGSDEPVIFRRNRPQFTANQREIMRQLRPAHDPYSVKLLRAR